MPTPPPTEPPTPRPTYTPAEWEAIIETALGYAEGCAPPCWHSITPGVSTQHDVVVKLEQLKRDAGILSSWSGGGNQYGGVLAGNDISVDIFLKDGKVESVQCDSDTGFRVEQVIDRFGEPEGVAFIDKTPSLDLSCEELEDFPDGDPTGTFLLLYPSQGMTFSGYRYYYGFICPQMIASRFRYYSPVSLSDALNAGKSPVFGLVDLNVAGLGDEDIAEWHGYGQGY